MDPLPTGSLGRLGAQTPRWIGKPGLAPGLPAGSFYGYDFRRVATEARLADVLSAA